MLILALNNLFFLPYHATEPRHTCSIIAKVPWIADGALCYLSWPPGSFPSKIHYCVTASTNLYMCCLLTQTLQINCSVSIYMLFYLYACCFYLYVCVGLVSSVCRAWDFTVRTTQWRVVRVPVEAIALLVENIRVKWRSYLLSLFIWIKQKLVLSRRMKGLPC